VISSEENDTDEENQEIASIEVKTAATEMKEKTITSRA
jgi:hypothetical protein